MSIQSIRGNRQVVALLASWHHAEWGRLYAEDRWNLVLATDELERMAAGRSSDHAWVAFDGDGREALDVVGSVALLASDDVDGFDHLTPWLASLYVRSDARGRGIAADLIDLVIDRAKGFGHDGVYLFTSGQEAYYLARGWRVVDTTEQQGHTATVMERLIG